MPSVSRTTTIRRDQVERAPDAGAPYRPAGRAGRRGSKPDRVDASSSRGPGPDLSTRLRLLQRALRGQVQRRETLIEVLGAVSATLDPARLAGIVVARAAGWFPAPCWAVVSADRSGRLTILADRGLTPDMGPAVYAVAGHVMKSGTEFTAANLRSDRRVAHDAAGTVLGFPLASRGRRIGVLIGLDRAASSRRPMLGAGLRRAVRVLLDAAATALDNALLLERVEALSVTDDLTQLYNSRYLNQVLWRETKRASRNGLPLSLVFIDLDGFKTINDAYGHLCGSRALVEAAAVVGSSARETDVVARFGGDEFALVLPDTDGEGAFQLGERIRDRIAAHRFLVDEGLDIHLTASIGVATLPEAATLPDQLIQAADMAMYRVKRSGRNGIQAALALQS
ncbi:MAG: sensor domain-containing diguanylate cyclase [Acidobacteriota bacterium]